MIILIKQKQFLFLHEAKFSVRFPGCRRRMDKWNTEFMIQTNLETCECHRFWWPLLTRQAFIFLFGYLRSQIMRLQEIKFFIFERSDVSCLRSLSSSSSSSSTIIIYIITIIVLIIFLLLWWNTLTKTTQRRWVYSGSQFKGIQSIMAGMSGDRSLE